MITRCNQDVLNKTKLWIKEMFYTKNSDKSRHKKVHILFQLKGDFKNNIVIGYKIERCKPYTIFNGKLDHY